MRGCKRKGTQELCILQDAMQNEFIQINIMSSIVITAMTVSYSVSQPFCVQHNHLPLPHLQQSFANDFSFRGPGSLSIWLCAEAGEGLSRGCMLSLSEGTPARCWAPQPATSGPWHITPRKRVHRLQHMQTLTCSRQEGCHSNRNSIFRQEGGPLDHRHLFGTPSMLGECRDMS